jgi:hypothetical protein
MSSISELPPVPSIITTSLLPTKYVIQTTATRHLPIYSPTTTRTNCVRILHPSPLYSSRRRRRLPRRRRRRRRRQMRRSSRPQTLPTNNQVAQLKSDPPPRVMAPKMERFVRLSRRLWLNAPFRKWVAMYRVRMMMLYLPFRTLQRRRMHDPRTISFVRSTMRLHCPPRFFLPLNIFRASTSFVSPFTSLTHCTFCPPLVCHLMLTQTRTVWWRALQRGRVEVRPPFFPPFFNPFPALFFLAACAHVELT